MPMFIIKVGAGNHVIFSWSKLNFKVPSQSQDFS